MLRPMIRGGTALAVSVFIARYAFAVLRDLQRYNRMRAMSDDPPLLRMNGDSPVRLLLSVPADLMRYLRISTM